MAPTGILAIALFALAGGLLLRALARRESDHFIARVIVVGALTKLVATIGRYFLITDLYGQSGDFRQYLIDGALIAEQIRSGTMPAQASETGTPFMEFIAGVVFTVAPPTLIAGFAIFSALSFIGQYLFLQAFRSAVPDGDHRRYALLIMFVPTMLFWPSSLGKEAWLVFTLGIACYGAARVLRRDRFGYLLTLLGAAGMYAVRPHMGALFALSFLAGFLLRFRDPRIANRAVGWVVGLVLVGVGAGFAASNFGELLPQDESVEGSQAEQIFAETTRRTSTGGSEFDSRPVRDPIDFLYAAVTVPFRPFPHEGHNAQAQLAGLEGVLLLGLVLYSIPRLRRLPRFVLRTPYIAMASAYSIGFIIAFSNVGNFGILTRQRAQLLPLLFVLLCLPAFKRARVPADEAVLTPMSAKEQQRLLTADGGRAPLGPAGTAPGGTELIFDLPDPAAPGSTATPPRASNP